MLDSSPLPIPPPKKLKRTASAASLPSPPPSVEHIKKRTTAQRFNSSDGSDTDSGSDEEVDGVTKGGMVVGRKLLFPSAPSGSSTVDDPENPFVDHSKPPAARDQLALDAASSPPAYRTVAPASPPPSRRRAVKTFVVPPRTPSPLDQRSRCTSSEMPVLDEDNNPFLSDSPPKPRRARSPRDFAEPPTITYVFKGVKTTCPNPHYNLPESAYERSRLPLSDPEYSPPPTRPPRRLFSEAFPSADDAEDDDEGSNSELGSADADLHTPDTKPRMSKLFVDEAGNPLPDSGPQGIRGKTMDARDIKRMAVGPMRGRG